MNNFLTVATDSAFYYKFVKMTNNHCMINYITGKVVLLLGTFNK